MCEVDDPCGGSSDEKTRFADRKSATNSLTVPPAPRHEDGLAGLLDELYDVWGQVRVALSDAGQQVAEVVDGLVVLAALQHTHALRCHTHRQTDRQTVSEKQLSAEWREGKGRERKGREGEDWRGEGMPSSRESPSFPPPS